MADEKFIIKERTPNDADGFSLADITGFKYEERSSGQGLTTVLILTVETSSGKTFVFNGDEADLLYKELKKLAVVV